MKKTAFLIYILCLLVVLATSSFAIYKSAVAGTAMAECAEVIISLETQEENQQTIDENNLQMDYNFVVKNNKIIDSVNVLNEVVANYYIKIVGLESDIFDYQVIYVDGNGTEIPLAAENWGIFSGMYKSLEPLSIDIAKTDSYILRVNVLNDDLVNYATRVSLDIAYEQVVIENNYVNAPQLASGMIPITWDTLNSQWVKTSKNNPNWYNYDDKKWANAANVLNTYNDGTNSDLSYINAPDGTPIPAGDVVAMWVWIPRFVYRINEQYYHTTILEGATLVEPPVAIHFSKTADAGGDEWDDTIVVVTNGTVAADCRNSWTTHSAFTFGNTYLDGIWVAKFQASNSDGTATAYSIDMVKIKPAVLIAKQLKINAAFRACRNMETNAIYGWNTAQVLQDDATFEVDGNGLDTHLIKNSEWSAMAYFTHSKYGIGGRNIANSSSSDYCGQSQSLSVVYSTNTNQSTTGNVYGIYDGASTTWDAVSAYIGDGSNINASALYNAQSKYKDEYNYDGITIDYTSKNSVYSIFEFVKDAAIWEVSTDGNVSTTSWFSGRSNIGSYSSNKYNLLITRGGAYTVSNIVHDSIFAFGYGEGNDAADTRSFRPVLIVHEGL